MQILILFNERKRERICRMKGDYSLLWFNVKTYSIFSKLFILYSHIYLSEVSSVQQMECSQFLVLMRLLSMKQKLLLKLLIKRATNKCTSTLSGDTLKKWYCCRGYKYEHLCSKLKKDSSLDSSDCSDVPGFTCWGCVELQLVHYISLPPLGHLKNFFLAVE